MKSAYILATALFVSVMSLLAQARPQDDSPLRFKVSEWSFGDIREEGGTVSRTFEFTNTAAEPVAIDRVVASCGCTTPEYPRTPVAPGGNGRIKVTFDPRGLPGDFSKNISVVSGGGKHRDFLTIKGHVIPRPKTVEEEYPYDAGGGLRISTTLLTFRSVPQGRSAAMVVGYANTSANDVTLAFEHVEGEGGVEIFAPETVCAGCRGEITFTYDLSERSLYGPVFDVNRPVVDGVHSSLTVYSTMTGIDDFSQVDMSLAPRLFLKASFHDFGEVRRRAMPYTFRLTASNEGSETLHIRSVSEAEGLRTTLREGMTIASGAELPFEVMFYSNRHETGEVRGTIRIVVDDPMRPTREIRISAIIK